MHKRCLLVFTVCFLLDFFQTWHMQACADRRVIVSVPTLLTIWVLSYFMSDSLIESKRGWERITITASGALGATIGNLAVMLLDL